MRREIFYDKRIVRQILLVVPIQLEPRMPSHQLDRRMPSNQTMKIFFVTIEIGSFNHSWNMLWSQWRLTLNFLTPLPKGNNMKLLHCDHTLDHGSHCRWEHHSH